MPIRLRSAVCPVVLVMSSACSGHPAAPTAAAVEVPMPVFAASSIAGHGEPAAPWTLTASDGSGLMLTRVDAQAVFQGPLAFTELHLYFHNPEARIREGTFAITLPAHAAVSRFAMEGPQGWIEAEVVEKMLARRAYETFSTAGKIRRCSRRPRATSSRRGCFRSPPGRQAPRDQLQPGAAGGALRSRLRSTTSCHPPTATATIRRCSGGTRRSRSATTRRWPIAAGPCR